MRAVRGVSFAVERGRTLGIVGESGSGKSVATQTIVGLTRGARVSGRATLDGVDLLGADAGDVAPHPRGPDRHDLPGPAVEPAPVLQGRVADRRGDPRARARHVQGRGAGAGDRAARRGRHPEPAQPDRQLPARVLRRHAATRDDRDGDGAAARGAGRRRADHGVGRHGAGAGARRDARRAAGVRHGDRADHARPGRGRRHGRRRRGDVRRAGDGAGPAPRAVLPPPPPLHRGAAALAADGRAPRAAHPDRRHAAEPDHAAAGLPVRTPLPVGVRRVRRDAAVPGDRPRAQRRRAGCPAGTVEEGASDDGADVLAGRGRPQVLPGRTAQALRRGAAVAARGRRREPLRASAARRSGWWGRPAAASRRWRAA